MHERGNRSTQDRTEIGEKNLFRKGKLGCPTRTCTPDRAGVLFSRDSLDMLVPFPRHSVDS